MDFQMENPIKMDDLGGKPTIFGNTQIVSCKKKKAIFSQVAQVPEFQGPPASFSPQHRVSRTHGGGDPALRVGFGDFLLPRKTWVGSGKILSKFYR